MEEVARGLASLVDRGVVTATEYRAMVISAWYRTAVEWQAPFESDNGLVLADLTLIDLGDPLWQQTHPVTGAGSGDYPARVAAALRVSFGPSLLGGLDPARRAIVATELFDQHLARAITAASPEPWFDWRVAVMTITKPG